MKNQGLSEDASAKEKIDWARQNYYSKSEACRELLNGIQSDQPQILANKYNILGILDLYDSKYQSSITHLKEALVIADKHSYNELKAKIYLNLCSVNERIDNLPEALSFAFKVFSTGYEKVYGSTYYNIARINFNLNNFEKANENLEESLIAYQKYDNPAVFHVYFLKAEILKENGNLSEALASYEGTLEHVNQTGLNMFRAATLNEIGHCLLLLDKPEESIPYIKEGIENAETYNIARDKFIGYLRLTQCYIALKEYNLADQYIQLFFHDNLEKGSYSIFYKLAHQVRIDLYKTNFPEKLNAAYEAFIQYLLNDEIAENQKLHGAYIKLKGLEIKELRSKSEEIIKQNNELRYISKLLAHDLKTPVRTIGSFTDLLHKRNEKHFSAESMEFYNFIKSGTHEINLKLDLTEKYLNLKLSTFDDHVSLNSIFKKVVHDNFKPHVNLELDQDTELIRVDVPLMRYAVKLLIRLFVQHAEGDSIQLRISSSIKDNQKVVRITDSASILVNKNIWKKEIFYNHQNSVSEGLLFFDKIINLHRGILICNEKTNSLDLIFRHENTTNDLKQ